jgi:uroporphyrin-3 C-methyltransferase
VNTEIPEIDSETPENSPEQTATPENPPEETAAPENPPEETAAPENPPAETEIKETKEEQSLPRRGGSVLSFFAFLFSLAALAGAGWIWWQDQASTGQEEKKLFAEITRLEGSDSELSLKLSQIRSEMDSLAAGDVGAEFEAMQKRLEADRSKMNSVEQAVSKQLTLSRSLQSATDSIQGRLVAAEAALTGLTTRELDAGGELDIAEVDYLLRLANERLQLFSDPAAADQALELADMHLAALDNPMYLGVRQDIAAGRRDLASVKIPDYLEISSQLDSIQNEVASLPLHGASVATPSSGEEDGDGWWQKVKNVFSNLVTVRRSTDLENQRISLQDTDYIRQRVWLQLEIAHLSLMRRDQKAFRASLERVQESLSTWFDASNSSYQTVKQGIDGLIALDVQVDVPDITAPWLSLRLLRATQTRPTPAPQQQIPANQPEAGAEGE